MNKLACSMAGALGMVAGCGAGAKAPPVPGAAMADASGIPLETLRRGHGVYVTQCGSCHELVQPAAVTVEDWHLVVPGMCWNAGLTKADEQLVLQYVLAARKP
jgi:hypothetical protein